MVIEVAAISFLLATACGSPQPAAPEGVFLPRLEDHTDMWPAALIFGELLERDGCIFIHPGYEGGEYLDALLIWPKEATADRSADGTLRIFVEGDLVGAMADHVELGGGFVGGSRGKVDHAESLTGMTIPERCRTGGGYWITPGG